jgi:telomere resolvase
MLLLFCVIHSKELLEMAKVWLQDRWPRLLDALSGLTLEQEDEIARICQEEMGYWRTGRKLGLGSLGNAVSATRKHLEEHFSALDSSNSWFNPKEGKQEHLSLKYMNLSKEQWAERAAPSIEKLEQRLQDRQFISDPDGVVSVAVSLLSSSHWQDIAVGLAPLTGRRLQEVLAVGSFSPHTRFSVTFKGQLKVHDRVMPPYEIPVLCEASLVLEAWDRLRRLLGASAPDEDQLTGVADKHFAELVPPRAGGSLYTHLFRAVYGCIAVFFYAKPEILDTVYLNRIYGHYWISESSGKLQADYLATQHYQDYGIADTVIAKYEGKRQGVKLSDPGVTLLEIFQEKTEQQKGSRKVQIVERPTRKPSQTGFSSAKPSEDTRARLDDIWVEIGARIDDDVLGLLCDEHYKLKTLTAFGATLEEIAALLAEASKESENPVAYLAEMLKMKASSDALTAFGVSLEAITALLADASSDNANPVKYLGEILKAKRDFKAGYDARVHGKDYASMKTSELRKHKAPEAAAIRFDRAIAAIMDYNAVVPLPEARWFISPAVLVDLVGGSPAGAKAHLEARPDIKHYHQDNKLSPGINRRGMLITERITVPELPGQARE